MQIQDIKKQMTSGLIVTRGCIEMREIKDLKAAGLNV